MSLSDRVVEPKGHWIAPQSTAEDVAHSVVATWQDIHAALSPIIGERGVTALYDRSLGLSTLSTPWLTRVRSTSRTEMDLAALHAVLLEHGVAEAAHVGTALFLSCQGLLSGLLGAALADRLLGPVWKRHCAAAAPPAGKASP